MGLVILLLAVMSFLSGSIPTGYILLKKIKNIDIRNVGSGNTGATNAKRAGGKKISAAVLLIDIMKGILPVYLSVLILQKYSCNFNLWISVISFLAVLGHNYSPFLKFKGGKGVSTTIGICIPIMIKPVIAAVIIFFLLRLITKIVSLRSICLGLVIILGAFLFNYNLYYKILSIILEALIIVRHKENIIRILRGTEK